MLYGIRKRVDMDVARPYASIRESEREGVTEGYGKVKSALLIIIT